MTSLCEDVSPCEQTGTSRIDALLENISVVMKLWQHGWAEQRFVWRKIRMGREQKDEEWFRLKNFFKKRTFKGKFYRNLFTLPALHSAVVSTPGRAITLQVATVHFKACCCPWQLSLVLWIVGYLCLCNRIPGFLWLFSMKGISLRALRAIGCHK